MRKIAAISAMSYVLLSISACSNRVDVPKKVANIDVRQTEQLPPNFAPAVGETGSHIGDEIVFNGCLAAWRKCLHGDQPGAMKDLNELDRKYPKTTTIQFMMGQVLDHSGKKHEAVKYYQRALSNSEPNSMYLFKLAEARRASGDIKGAIVEYKRLLELLPNFVPAKLGLARSLQQLDPESPQAIKQIQEALKLEPQNKEALELLKDKTRSD